jgi:hypothetical protein
MGSVSVIVKHLKKEKDKVEKQLSALNLALSAFVGSYYGAKPAPTRFAHNSCRRAIRGYGAQPFRHPKIYLCHAHQSPTALTSPADL